MTRDQITSALDVIGGGAVVAGGFLIGVGVGVMFIGALLVVLSWRLSQ